MSYQLQEHMNDESNKFYLEKAIFSELESKIEQNKIDSDIKSDNFLYNISFNSFTKKERQAYLDSFNHKDILSILPDSIDLSRMNYGARWFLQELVKKGYAEELAKKLPTTIDLENLNYNSHHFLMSLIEKGHSQSIFDKLPSIIDLGNTNAASGWFLSKLQKKYKRKLIRKLPHEIDLESMKPGSEAILLSLLEINSQEILNKIPTINLTRISRTAGMFLIFIVDKYKETIFDKLPNQIDLNRMSMEVGFLLEKLSDRGYKKEIFRRLSSKIDFSIADSGTRILLIYFFKKGFQKEIIKKLPNEIKLSNITEKIVEFIVHLIRNGYQKEIFDRLPSEIDLGEVNAGGSTFIRHLIHFNYDLGNTLKINNRDIRKPISASDLKQAEINTNNSSLLIETIKNFPIKPGSAKKLKGGWTYAELDKDGSQTFVYINLETNPPKIIFKNKKIGKESFDTYKKAIQILPGYVSSPYYPELNNNKGSLIPKLRGDSFREVFAGLSLEKISIMSLPKSIRTEINKQKFYILLQLKKHKINHGHPKDANFNVRFLLEDKSGNKTLMFDPNKAINIAKEKDMTLTPIVTLRDWDQASSDT